MVSIIIPIYNSGERLRRCLDSVMAQTYADIEVLMVNDGSTDNSAQICTEFANHDKRFIYIEQQNSGVSNARNNGLSHSSGEYICFVDSDDSVLPCYVECMVESIIATRSDIVVQGLNNVYQGNVLEEMKFPNITMQVQELNDDMFEKLFYFCGPYCKLFHADYIHNEQLKFPEDLQYGEDFVFYASYLHLCKRISFLSNICYNYSVSVKGSLSSVQLSPEKFWKNQVNRRGQYKKLRKLYGIERDFYPTENKIKIVALRGLLSSIKRTQGDMNYFIEIVLSNKDFAFSDIRPLNILDTILLLIIRLRGFVRSSIIKKMW